MSTQRPNNRPLVIVANPADGGVGYWLIKLYGFVALTVFVLLLSAGLILFRIAAKLAPEPPDLRSYATVAPAVSRMLAIDGTVLGEFADEWRDVVPYEQIPRNLVNAFLAAEDHEFWQHGGISLKSIIRAMKRNAAAGNFVEGGSTITQQVAKQFVVDKNKLATNSSVGRKLKEAILARRLEATYSKQAILSLYLNHIYLGAGAWGVAAAAHRYFQKTLPELTLAEAALIAGLANAPTAFSPLRRPERARARRNEVLDKMLRFGYIDAAQAQTARDEALTLNPYRDVFPERMPYYAEYVRSDVIKRYGEPALNEAGLTIETAADPAWEAAAYETVDFGTRHQDKRQGWRGPVAQLAPEARPQLIARQQARYGRTGLLALDQRYLALVESVRGDGATVRIADRVLELPLRNMQWAAPWHAGNAQNDETITSARQALSPGDVIWVRRENRVRGKYRVWGIPDGHNPAWRGAEADHAWNDAHPEVVTLEQVPHPQGALFTGDHRNGYVTSMVGGYDHGRSVFNRAVQACRQPGSTYKPIYYALALDKGYGFDTVLNDVPVQIVDPDTGETWTPTNLGDTLDGDVTLEYALVFSKNIPSVDIFQRLGAKQVEAWARRLGFTSKIFADDALALGASCVHLDELTRAFALFARQGRWWARPVPTPAPPDDETHKAWIYIRRVYDRAGVMLEDNTVPDDPMLPTSARFDRLVAFSHASAPQAFAARTGFLASKLLAKMVTHGFTNTLRATGIHAAGKTGTSSATHDNSFVAFTSRFAVATWLGDDKKQRALGAKDAAYMTVVPLFARYMYDAARGYPNPEIPWEIPPGVQASDRGDHAVGEHGPQMDLIYRKHETPTDAEAPSPPAP